MSSASAAQIVNGILDRYIAIHDQIVKFSIDKILPIPGIFKPIQYCKHQEQLKGLETELAGARGAIRLAMEVPELALTDRQFLESLDLYAGTLNDAIILLGRVSSELCLKSRNEGDYPWQMYQRDMQAYREAVQRYSELGKELNTLYSRVTR